MTGALYTLGWVASDDPNIVQWCPMHEEPLHLVPERFRDEVAAKLNAEPRRRPISGARSTASSAPSAATSTPIG